MEALSISLPPELLEGIATRVAEIVLDQLDKQPRAKSICDGPRWIHGAQAASDHTSIPVGQVQKLSAAGAMPHRKIGGRNVYRTDELDDWLDDHYEGPARGVPRLRAVP